MGEHVAALTDPAAAAGLHVGKRPGELDPRAGDARHVARAVYGGQPAPGWTQRTEKAWIMPRHLITALLCVGFAAANAHAIVRMFFTSSAQPYGLTEPSLAFQPTLGLGQDAASYQVAAFPPLESWGQIPTINWQAGEFAYMWVRFHQEPNNKKVQGIHLDLDDFPAEVAYYVMDDLSGANADRRWDGAFTMPDAPEFKQDPGHLAAVTTHGIINRATDVDAWNLYDEVTRTALLGAARYASDGLRGAWVWSGQTGPVPPPIPPPPWYIEWDGGQANWVPEPATLCLLAALSVAVRRNRRSDPEER
jgi:hypothetical protein